MTSVDVTRTSRSGRGPPPTGRIPLSRIVTTELRKMFDTRSGFWLMASIGILALLATGAVVAFSSERGMTYSSFATAIGFPMTSSCRSSRSCP